MPTDPPPSPARLGVDLGGTKIAGALLEADGAVSEHVRVPTPRSYDETLVALRDLADRLAPDRGVPMGVGIPGSVSPSTGRVRNANTTFLNGRDLLHDLQSAAGRQVRLANDADCFTLSEATDGAAAGARAVFGVIIGTGCGGGIAIDGALIPGASGIAGEWGHVPLPWPTDAEHPGPLCWCGLRGCLEKWVSGTGFEADYRVRAENAGGPDPNLRAPDIATRAAQGEPVATAALDAYVSRLGRGLAMICNIVDPAVIVLGGGMSNTEALYDRLPAAIAPFVFTDKPVAKVVRNRHGDDSGLRGAARLWSAPAAPQPAGASSAAGGADAPEVA